MMQTSLLRPKKRQRYYMSIKGYINDVSEQCMRNKDAKLPDIISVVHLSCLMWRNFGLIDVNKYS